MKLQFKISQNLQLLIDAISKTGGRPIAVGGSVRDHLLGLEAKDVDIEVHGLTPEVLQETLENIGPTVKVHCVGKSFAVYPEPLALTK